MNPWTFVFASDIHIGSAKSYRYAPSYNENWQTARRQMEKVSPEFLLLGGDLTRDGYIHDFEMWAAKQELDSLPFPYHAVPGNVEGGDKYVATQGAYDVIDDLAENVSFDRLHRFQGWFGPFPWTFVHRNVRCSGFYAAVAGSDTPQEQQMWQWLEDLARQPKSQYHVMITHYPLFLDDINEPSYDHTIKEQYKKWYANIDQPYRLRMFESFKAAGVNFAVSGHLHQYRTDVVDGITFIKAPATNKAQWRDHWPDSGSDAGFLRFDVADDKLEHTFVRLECVSTAKGYGPAGHPRAEVRDYSKAWGE